MTIPATQVDVIVGVWQEHVEVAKALSRIAVDVAYSVDLIVATLRAGGRLLLAGNGGSAADAQHIAAELTGRYMRERRPLPALALHSNTSAVTAIANDYGYEQVFARELAAHARPGDVFL